ncbi:MAG TPA: GNAT family N-acetyltransferase [Solimonas sp.]|nr:GNAT family N-acetyltransferase [Solimonas sp.]
MSLRLESLQGPEIAAHLDALAAVRCAVFRDWPYLYEGSHDYEAKYLQVYIDCPRALAVLVWDGDRCVGASTAIPLADAPRDMQQPFLDAGMDLSRIDYFGESVLLPGWRGRGLGVRFFELRETHARALGLSLCAFCAVERPVDHPLRPADHVPNDAFWHRRGYRPAPALRTTLSWPDLGESAASAKPMNFWLRELGPQA